MLRKARAFSVAEFDRRQPTIVSGVALHVATAEDTILAKLEWAKLGQSERQLRDVRGILDTRGDTLDVAYVERWAVDLDVLDAWHRVRANL